MSHEHVGYPYDFAKEDPIEQFWVCYGRKADPKQEAFEWYEVEPLPPADDAWSNGQMAFGAIAFGLLAMVMLSWPL